MRALTADRELGVLAAGQHVRRLLGLADRAYLLDQGRVVVEGTAAVLRDDPHVRRTLLELAP